MSLSLIINFLDFRPSAIANGPVPNGPMMPNGSSYGGAGGYEFQSQATDFSSPLSHLNESVASLDPLAAMEKSLNHHEQVWDFC